jgi:dTMP kinase
MRTAFIVIEGADGAGTTTQALALCKELEKLFLKESLGRHAIFSSEPFTNPLGQSIRQLLKTMEPDKSYPQLLHDEIALSFALNRLQHYNNYIKPHLGRNNSVICDRHTLSSLVYQSISCDEGWVREINKRAPKPDLMVYIDTPLEVCIERIKNRGTSLEYYEGDLFAQRIHRKYEEEIEKTDIPVFKVDGRGSAQEISNLVLARVAPLLGF